MTLAQLARNFITRRVIRTDDLVLFDDTSQDEAYVYYATVKEVNEYGDSFGTIWYLIEYDMPYYRGGFRTTRTWVTADFLEVV